MAPSNEQKNALFSTSHLSKMHPSSKSKLGVKWISFSAIQLSKDRVPSYAQRPLCKKDNSVWGGTFFLTNWWKSRIKKELYSCKIEYLVKSFCNFSWILGYFTVHVNLKYDNVESKRSNTAAQLQNNLLKTYLIKKC